MPNNKNSEIAVAKRMFVEELLGRYPEISHNEKDILIQWYRKEASSLDVAMVSQIESINSGYKAFRSEMDRFRFRDMIPIMILIGVIAATFALIYFHNA